MASNRPRKPRPRQPSDRSNGKSFKDKAEADFLADLENRVRYFMESEDTELEFEPMNSYKRRLVHHVAKPFKLDTDSRGEEPERYVCLIKTSTSQVPKGAPKTRLLDFGTITYPVSPGEQGLRLALKVDGSLEIWREGQTHLVLDERVVTARQVRIRKGKIVQPGEPDW
jgi:hypothetical protein